MTTYALTISTAALGLGILSNARVTAKRKRTVVSDVFPSTNITSQETVTDVSGIATIMLAADDGTVFHEVRIYNSRDMVIYSKAFTMPPQNVALDLLPLEDIISASAYQAVQAKDAAQTSATNAANNETNAANSADSAATNATSASNSAIAALTSATIASNAQLIAESARDAALIQSGVYTTEAAGRAAVADGVAFKVQGSGDIAAYEYRRVDSSSSTLIATYPSSTALQTIKNTINETGNNSPTKVEGIGDPLAIIYAHGADGYLYNLMAFMENGTIDSVPLDIFVTSKLGGQSYTNITASDWGSLVFTQLGADGLLYALAGILADNSFYATGISASGSAGEVIHIPLLGQSNMAADQATPIITTTNTSYGNYKFQRGIATWSSSDNATTPASRLASGFTFTALTASGVETRANGLADAYKARVCNASRYSAKDLTGSPHVLVSFSGVGSRRLTDLGPIDSGATDGGNTHAAPGGYWPTMLDDITRAKAQALTLGLSYSVPCWFYDQGEREGDGKLYETGSALANSALISGYTTLALSMVNTFDSAVRTITGQTRPIPLLVTPACSTLLTATAWQNTADQTDLCVLVGPRYQMPSAYNATSGTGGSQVWGDSIHHTADGHRWIGEMCAKVMHRHLNEGERWQPLRALSASKVDATTVDVVMNVPRPPMIIDTTLLAKCLGWGFSIYGGSVDAPSGRVRATAISLQADGRTVRLTFASIPAGAFLAIGADSLADLGITPTVTAVGVGEVTPSGFSTYTVTVAGDIRPQLTPLTREGAFFLYGTAPSRGIIRSVALVGSDTVMTGEVRELRSDGAFVPFAVSNTLTFARAVGFTNIRDSDTALSINKFTNDPRNGQLYPLHNWLCQYDGLAITGA